jgi:DNA primase
VRTAGLLLEHGFLVYLVELPSGYDPDAFVREHGAAALETRVREAPSYIAAMKLLVDRRAGDLAVKERVLRHVLDDLARVGDAVLRELYGAELARHFGLSDAALAAALEQRMSRAGTARTARRDGEAAAAAVEGAPAGAVIEAQRGLLRLGLQGPTWVERLAEVMDPEDFAEGPPRRMFEALRHAEGVGGAWLAEIGTPEDRSLVSELNVLDPLTGDLEQLFRDYVAALKGARLEAQETQLRQRLQEAEQRGDAAETARLLAESQRLAQDRSGWKTRAAWNRSAP